MEVSPNHPKPNASDEGSALPPTPIVYESEEYYWEYKQIKLNLNDDVPLEEGRLNELGKEGWELVAVVTHNKTAHYYFKRPAEES